MVRSIKVTNYLGDELLIDPFDPESSGFLITNLKGITPEKADINFTDITTQDGGLYNSARINTRNITMSLLYFPKPTIEATRLLSYKYFPVKKEIKLEFTTDTRKAEIIGYVEANEVNIYTKSEYSAISIVCPDPYFYSTSKDTEINVSFSNVLPAFRFRIPEFSDAPLKPSKTPAKKLIFSKMKNDNNKLINYTGDAEVGMEIVLRASGEIGDFTVYNVYTQESMTISSSKLAELTGSSLIAGDVITIYTYRGNKKLELLRTGITTNVLNCLGKNTSWLQLHKGDNVFSFSATSGGDNVELELKSKTLYEGL